jgi:hypothetical protein
MSESACLPAVKCGHLRELILLWGRNVMNNGLTGEIPPALGKLGNLILL